MIDKSNKKIGINLLSYMSFMKKTKVYMIKFKNTFVLI